MKRILLLFILIVLTCSLASASVVIEAEGRGKTLDEAKENARKALAEKVFPGLMYSETFVSVSDDTTSSSSLLTEESSYTVFGELSGFDYSVVSSKKNNYVVTAKITGDDATISFYSGRMEEQGESAKDLYEQYIALGSSVSATRRKESLQSVLTCYSLYTMYGDIIRKLGGTIADVDILPKTYTVLRYELDSLINEEENELLRKSNSESISQEIREKLQANAEEKEANEKALEEAKTLAKEQTALKLQQKLDEYAASWAERSSLPVSDAYPGLESFYEYLDVIQEANADLVEMIDMYDRLIEEQSEAVEKSYTEEAAAIRSRTYPSAHLDLDGNPTPDAKELRENEVKELRTQKNKEKQDLIDVINSSTLVDEIKKRYNYYDEAVSMFSNEEFRLSSSEENLSLSVSNYDGANYCWNLTLSIADFSGSISGIKLAYSTLTGKPIPLDKTARLKFIASDEYKETVDVYNKILHSGQFEYHVIFTASVDAGGKLHISVKSLNLQFADGAEVSIKLDEEYVVILDDFYEISYSWIKTESGNGNASSSDTEKKKTETENKRVETTKSKEPLKISFTPWIRFGGTFGKLLNENMKIALDTSVEFRLRLSDFFVSSSFDLSYWFVTGLGSRTGIPQLGVSLGSGYRFFDFMTVALRASYSRDLGLLLLPVLSFTVIQNNELLGSLDVFCGCNVNCRTGRVAVSVGMESIILNLGIFAE